MRGYIESGKFVTHVLRAVRLLDQLRKRIPYLDLSLPTEKAYLY
jgi:hypothetical protein